MKHVLVRHLSRFGATTVLLAAGWPSVAEAQTEPVVVGGTQGAGWLEATEFEPVVIRGPTAVEKTNTPGGVIDFDVADREHWIFPQKVDSTKNIMIALGQRGGSMTTPTFGFKNLVPQFPNMIDDKGETALEVRAETAGQSAKAFGFILQIDLGAVFGINRIKFFPRNADPLYEAPTFPFQKDFLKSFEIFVNDGGPENERDGVIIFESLDIVSKNEDAVVDLRIQTELVRYLRLKSLTNTEFEIAEFQMFARGYVPEATYVSDIYDFERRALLGNIRWVQEQVGDPTASTMRVRTRSGSDPLPVVYPRVGLQASGRIVLRDVTGGARPEEIPIEALWKKATHVDDAVLKEIVETVLDNTDKDGRDVLLDYRQLPPEQRAALEIDHDYYYNTDLVAQGERRNLRDDLTDWSPWSSPYEVTGIVAAKELGALGGGTPITSPSPRRYFQFMVEFENRTFDAATGLGGLAFDVARPAFADSLIAEILPRTGAVGQTTPFTYAVLSKWLLGDVGFDQLEIDTPLQTEAVRTVVITGPDLPDREADFSDRPLVNLPLTDNEISVMEVRDDGFIISFPRVESDSVLIKVGFDNAILRYGTRFTGRARNAANPFLGQTVIPGNAADLSNPVVDLQDPDTQPIGGLDAKNLTVVVPIARDLLVNVKAEPPVFTPNGDGTNDECLIRYDVTNIAEATPVKINIYDLSGRLISSREEPRNSGRFSWSWKGTNDGGGLTPPGNYIFSVRLDAGPTETTFVGVVAVAY